MLAVIIIYFVGVIVTYTLNNEDSGIVLVSKIVFWFLYLIKLLIKLIIFTAKELLGLEHDE